MTNQEFKIQVVPLSKKLLRFATYLLKEQSDAQDIVQEVYVKLWSMRNELDKYESIEAFAMRITRNKCTDLLRERTRKYASSIDEVTIKDASEEEREKAVDVEESVKRVKELIRELPDNYRELITLKDIEGYDFNEISDILGVNVNTLRVSLSRARKKLRELISQRCYETR